MWCLISTMKNDLFYFLDFLDLFLKKNSFIYFENHANTAAYLKPRHRSSSEGRRAQSCITQPEIKFISTLFPTIFLRKLQILLPSYPDLLCWYFHNVVQPVIIIVQSRRTSSSVEDNYTNYFIIFFFLKKIKILISNKTFLVFTFCD